MLHRNKSLKYLFIGISLGAILSAFALVLSFRDWSLEDARRSEIVQVSAETVSRAIVAKIDSRLNGLSAFQQALSSTDIGSNELFAATAALVDKTSGGYLALNLIDPHRRIVQVWPEEPNRMALGRIVGQSPDVVGLLDDAIANNEPKATGLVDLFQGGQGIAVYYPIQRNGRFAGFLNAVFRIGDLDADLLAIVPTRFRLQITVGAIESNQINIPAPAGESLAVSINRPILNQSLQIAVEFPSNSNQINNRKLSILWQVALCTLTGLMLSSYLILTRKSRAEEALLASVLKSSPIAFVSVNDHGQIIKFNPAAESMFGYSSAQMLGRSIELLVPQVSRLKHSGLVKQFFRSSAKHQYMGDWRWIEAVRSDATSFHISVLLTKAVVDGDQITTAMMTDMTGEQTRQRELLKLVEDRAAAAERAESANKAKTIFLASMSHELRTPLNAIIGFSEIINHEVFGPIQPPKYREYLHDIHNSAQGLLAVINDILDYSKIEAGAVNLDIAPFDIAQILDQSVRTATGIAKEKNLLIKFEPSKNLPSALGDPRATRQVFLNLISNAVKFSPKGGSIVIRTLVDVDKNEIAVEIQDDGPGISHKDISNLGTPFYQARQNIYHASEGTGLGLAICIGLMKSMNSKLQIDSDLGRGTTARAIFKVAVPA